MALYVGFFATGALAQTATKNSGWQCVTFARSLTGFQIFGDAWTWWEKASGKYQKGNAPAAGSVLVFRPTGKMSRGHVAVVSQVLTDRVIQITHANWSPMGGRRGQVEENVTVIDVSPRGDWSQVRVWFAPIKDLGTTVYPTYGFIYDSVKSGTEKTVRNGIDTLIASGKVKWTAEELAMMEPEDNKSN
ncbi:MAG: CHAP domain-containing protein [Asticcacaulis sp.]